MESLVKRIKRNAITELWINFNDDPEQGSVDIRLFVKTKTGKLGWRPTAKGVKFNYEQFKELLEALNEINQKWLTIKVVDPQKEDQNRGPELVN